MEGGVSQMDTFDFKPELKKYHGQDMPESFGKADVFFGRIGRLHRSGRRARNCENRGALGRLCSARCSF